MVKFINLFIKFINLIYININLYYKKMKKFDTKLINSIENILHIYDAFILND